MRTETINIFYFDELSEEAKQKAIEKVRYSDMNLGQYDADEITDSVKKVLDLFNLKTGNRYSDLRWQHIESDILELSGIRLYKYLINNYGPDLFKPAYVKLLNREIKTRAFICKKGKSSNGEIYTQLFKKWKFNNDCVLTGVCFDNDILQPVYDFLARPDKSTTFEDLFKGIESAIEKTYEDSEEYCNSDDYIKDIIENNEYEFYEDGTQY